MAAWDVSKPLVAGALACALAAASAAHAQGAGDITGTWTLIGYKGTGRTEARQRIPQTVEGTAPPLQPWAQALYDQRLADSDRGQPFAPTGAYCLPLGMPLMMMAADMPIHIVRTPAEVDLMFEEQHAWRAVRLGGKHPEDLDPSFYGDSVGRFEGDVLVVDTVGLNERTTLDMTGMPHSEALHVTERIRRVDADTLEDLITIDDPKTFIRPWTTRMRYRAFKDRMIEYICENNRNMPDATQHATFQVPH
jgi:hypothetical protein